jgi:hypothetical protein
VPPVTPSSPFCDPKPVVPDSYDESVSGFGADRGAAARAVVLVRDGLDALADVALPVCTGGELVEALRELEVQKRRWAALEWALVGEVQARGVAGEYACASTVALLSQLLRIDAREAAGRVRAAGELAARRGLSGEVLPAIFAATAAACAAGEIAPAHARIITTTITELPHAVAAERDLEAEAFLLEQARQFDPRTLRIVARRLSDTLNPDGRRLDDADRARLRAFSLRVHADGTCTGSFRTDAITGEALQTFFDAAAQPVDDDSGEPDTRTGDMRRHDAIRDLLLRSTRAGELPATGGITTTIVLTMTPQQLLTPRRADTDCGFGAVPSRPVPEAGGDGWALRRPVREAAGDGSVQAAHGDGLVLTGHGALISLDEALSLLGDAQVHSVLLGGLKRIEAYSDTHRIFTQAQRLAMFARDLGCSFPGCTAPASWCQAHHVTDFAETRRTTVADGTLLCSYHHRHFADRGWSCEMRDGIPHWIPPRWIDPTQTPRRNHAHLPDLPALRKSDRDNKNRSQRAVPFRT